MKQRAQRAEALAHDRDYHGDRPMIDPVVIERIVVKPRPEPHVKKGWSDRLKRLFKKS